MSAMPMPAMIPLSMLLVRIAASHFVESVPRRLYGVSKSNLPFDAASAATGRNAVLPLTAPANAVNPALRRKDRRFSPLICAMHVLPRPPGARARKECPGSAKGQADTTPERAESLVFPWGYGRTSF